MLCFKKTEFVYCVVSLGLAAASLLLLPGDALGQQDWPTVNSSNNAAPSALNAPQFNAPQFNQPAQSKPQFGQQPFSNQVQGVAPQATFGSTVSQPEQAPLVAQRMSIPAQSATVAKSSLAVPDDSGKATDKSTDNGITDDLVDGVDAAKNTLMKAVQNDRDAQVELATKYLLPILVIFVVMSLANWVGSVLRDRVSGVVSKRVDLTLGRFAGTLTKFLVLFVSLMSLLSFYGAEMTSLAALVAALGFAVGMALQGTLGNFAAGIALLVFRPFNVGDYIVVDGFEGTVQAIELFTTSIDTHDNRRIILPNESVFGNRIENWTHNDTRRVEVLVGVAYSADMKQTRQVLANAMTSVAGALPTPAPQIYLCELNASSVDWSCRVWCRSEDYLAVKERVTETAKAALDRNGIGIPFPQLDLHVVSSALQQKSRSAAA